MNLVRRLTATLPRVQPGTWLEQSIGFLSPKWAYHRAQYRAAASVLKKQKFGATYRGAEKNRLRNDWLVSGGSADADLLDDLPTLRERSRDLDRNDPWARSVYNTIAVNAIGTGLVPQSQVSPDDVGATPDAVRAWQRATERIWRQHMPLLDLQQRVHGMIKQVVLFRAVIQSGDAIDLPVRVTPGGRRALGFTTEMIEGDRLRTPTDLSNDQRARVRDGVELNDAGTPQGYWILKHHPGDQYLPHVPKDFSTTQFTRYPARNAMGHPNLYHLFWTVRPGQNRGEPWMAPALSIFKDLGDFMEAKIVAERVGACFGIVIKKIDPTGALLANTTANPQGQRLDAVEPGMTHYLDPNEDITTVSPDLKGTDLDAFVQVFVRQMGAAIGLPYELITKDFTKTTWHSARASLLETWRFFRLYQAWFANTYLQPMWDVVMLEAWSRGLLPPVDLLGPNMADWLRTRWVPPGRGYIDPVREIAASLDAIKGGLSTYSDELAQQGKDWEEIMEQQQREAEKRKELGLDEQPEETESPTDPNTIPREDLPDDVNQAIDDVIGTGAPA
ncbi:MAG: phage portal protein [Nitrospirales bacterium]